MLLTIKDLPEDIFINLIYKYLNFFEIITLSRVNKNFNNIYHRSNKKIKLIYIDKKFSFLTSDEKDAKYFTEHEEESKIMIKYAKGKPVKTFYEETWCLNSYLIYKNKIYIDPFVGQIGYRNLTPEVNEYKYIENTYGGEIVNFEKNKILIFVSGKYENKYITYDTDNGGIIEIKNININITYIDEDVYLMFVEPYFYVHYFKLKIDKKIENKKLTYIGVGRNKKYIVFSINGGVIIYKLYADKIISIPYNSSIIYFDNLFLVKSVYNKKTFVYTEDGKIIYVIKDLFIITAEKDKYLYVNTATY